MAGIPTINLSNSDIEMLARIVQAEAGNQTYDGQRGAAWAVLNRMRAKPFPNSMQGVIEQKRQFEPMIGLNTVWDLPPASDSVRRNVMSAITAGDNTNGATFFQNAAITKKRGTDFGYHPPTATIEDHSFYNRYKNNAKVDVGPFTVAIAGKPHGAGGALPPVPESRPNDYSADFARLAQNFPRPQAHPDGGVTPVPTPASRPAGPTPRTRPDPQFMFASGSSFGRGALAARNEIYQHANQYRPMGNSIPGQAPSFSAAALAYIPKSQSDTSPSAHSIPSDPHAAPPNQAQYNMLKPAGDHVSFTGVDPRVLSAANAAASHIGLPLTVNSAFRSQAKQDSIRSKGDPNRATVAKKSKHTHGEHGSTALDFSTDGLSRDQQAALIDALAAHNFTGFGHYSGHIHADMRPAVPSSFGKRANWAGWTNMPEQLMAPLIARGFAAGVPATAIRRGF